MLSKNLFNVGSSSWYIHPYFIHYSTKLSLSVQFLFFSFVYEHKAVECMPYKFKLYLFCALRASYWICANHALNKLKHIETRMNMCACCYGGVETKKRWKGRKNRQQHKRTIRKHDENTLSTLDVWVCLCEFARKKNCTKLPKVHAHWSAAMLHSNQWTYIDIQVHICRLASGCRICIQTFSSP